MTPTAVSPTHPRIGYAYSATRIQGTARSECTVIYRGFSAGMYVLETRENTYKGIRVSDDTSEPAFEFDVTDVKN